MQLEEGLVDSPTQCQLSSQQMRVKGDGWEQRWIVIDRPCGENTWPQSRGFRLHHQHNSARRSQCDDISQHQRCPWVCRVIFQLLWQPWCVQRWHTAIRVHTDVNSDVCNCRCRMSTGFPANVDGNVENISIYHGKKAQKPQNHMLKKCRIICWYIYIYISTYTHTHTHKKAHFSSIFTKKSAKKYWLTPKNVNVDWKHLQMSNICRCWWFLQMLTRYGRHFYTPLHGDAWANARLLVDSGSEHPPLISQTLSDTLGLLCEVFPIYLSSPTRNRARLHCPCIKSDFRLGGRPISKMLETGPGRCRRAKCEVRYQKQRKKLHVWSHKNFKKMYVRSHQKWKKEWQISSKKQKISETLQKKGMTDLQKF